ncbi:MAG: hypothetical protein R3F11_05820 [Verrucomicrobiales bacterium]
MAEQIGIRPRVAEREFLEREQPVRPRPERGGALDEAVRLQPVGERRSGFGKDEGIR